MPVAKAAALATVLLVGVSSFDGCTCSRSTPLPSPAASASAAQTEPPAASEDHEGDGIRPVYPPLSGAPDPLAAKLCDALFALPARRRAACCGGEVARGLVDECLRNVSGALATNGITLDEAAVDRCAAAYAHTLEGCDWVTPFGRTPATPPACRGLAKGSRRTGAACRSSLECAEGLRCHGVSPTTVGRCGPPRERGACNVGADVLATYLRDDDSDAEHRECAGACVSRRCEPLAKLGEACKSNDICGPTAHCEDGRCAQGAWGRAGSPCLGGRCAPGLQCVAGKCAEPKHDGDLCDGDAECRGACVREPGASSGKCEKSCTAGKIDLRAQPSASAFPLPPKRHLATVSRSVAGRTRRAPRRRSRRSRRGSPARGTTAFGEGRSAPAP